MARVVRAVLHGVDAVACRRRWTVFLVGMTAFLLCLATAQAVGWPEPRVHDEFSYLLAGDTFARGRLSNPTPPVWTPLETFHVNFQPTYSSIFPPVQGLFLAVGKLLGHPALGVWLSVSLACGGLCWMLQAFVPPRAALFGGLLGILLITASGFDAFPAYWSMSYWGGAPAALGGALVFGSLRRLLDSPRPRYSILLALGLALLANCRPYEGLVVSLPAAAALGCWLIGPHGPPFRWSLLRVVLPITLVLLATTAWMLCYNQRATGDPWLHPHVHYERNYAIAPLFLWQGLHPEPAYRHPIFRAYNRTTPVSLFLEQQDWKGFWLRTWDKASRLRAFFLPWILLLPVLVCLPWLVRRPWSLLALTVCLLLLAALLPVVLIFPHYFAPATGMVLVLVVDALRLLNVSVYRLVKIAGIPFILVVAGYAIQQASALAALNRLADEWSRGRANFQYRLTELGGRHLIFVRYLPGHSWDWEWVANGAEPSAAPVVWARDTDAATKGALVESLPGRTLWLLETDDRMVSVRKLDGSAGLK